VPDDEDVPDTGVLAQFLERVSLVADTDEIPEHTAGLVTLMTLHTAKGLEFPVVFRHRMGRRNVPAHAGFGRRRRAFRGASTGLRRDHPSATASLCQPRQGSVVVGTADAQPGIAVFCARSAGAHRLASHRPDAVVQRAGERCWTVRRTAAVADARRSRQASAAGAGAGDRVTHDKYGLGRVEEVSGIGESAMSLIARLSGARFSEWVRKPK